MTIIKKKSFPRAHDQFVKSVMTDHQFAKEFLSIHLPADIREIINFNHLKMQPNSYINDVRKESAVDILYETKIADRKACLYLLIEHQSTLDKTMPFRVFKYTCNVMDAYIKKYRKKCLPLVYPLVIYHGTKKYRYSTDIRNLIDGPKDLIDKYFLKPFHLIDLRQIPDDELKKHQAIGVMEIVLKHIFARNLLKQLETIVEPMHELVIQGKKDYIEKVLQYALIKGDIKNPEQFFQFIDNNVSTDIGKTIMNAYELGLREKLMEGRAEGRAEEKINLVKQMHMNGFDASIIAKALSLSDQEVESILL